MTALRRPLVSVCVPTYNGAMYLKTCLRAIKAQDFSDYEVLIVDDGSTDGTMEIARAAAARDPRVRFLSNGARLGLVGNWNRCVSLAQGQWIKFVFQDDWIKPNALSRMLGAALPGDMLVVCRRAFRYERGTPRRVRAQYARHLAEHGLANRFPGRNRVTAAAFARILRDDPACNIIGEPTTALIRRSAFDRWGFFNADIVNLCDWEFLARIASNGGLAYIDDSLAVFRVHPRAESAFNRAHRAFQSEVLDELVIRHQLAYSSAYAAMRKALPAGSIRTLKETLGAAARGARAALPRYSFEAKTALDGIITRYPRLAPLTKAPINIASRPPLGSFARHRDAALALLQRHRGLVGMASLR